MIKKILNKELKVFYLKIKDKHIYLQNYDFSYLFIVKFICLKSGRLYFLYIKKFKIQIRRYTLEAYKELTNID